MQTEFIKKYRKEVKPILDIECLNYLRNLKNKTGKITKDEIQEFANLVTKDDKTFSSYIAFIDVFNRRSVFFKIITAFHLRARKENSKYFEYGEKICKEEESDIWWLNRWHSNWLLKNSDKIFKVLNMPEEIERGKYG